MTSRNSVALARLRALALVAMAEAASPAGGYIHVLPVILQAGMSVTHVSFAPLPWSSPAYSGLLGNSSGEPTMVVGYEWPIPWIATVQELPKNQREWLCLRRFSADQALAAGVHAFAEIQPGADPPDCTVVTDEGTLGVEVTALAIEDRRGAYALFRTLRRQLLMQDPRLFAKLAGNVVYVWFGDTAGTELVRPFKRTDDDMALDLIRELAEYVPEPHRMWHPGGPAPDQLPKLPIADTAGHARFYALPLAGAVPGTMMFTVHGFEIGMAYTSLITSTTAWQIVQKLLDDHDQPGVDVLLITACAPDGRGNVHPAEEALAAFLLDNPGTLIRSPTHIKKVWLHSWSTGCATALYPAVEHMFGPLYQTLTPVHHPLIALAQPGSPDGPEASEFKGAGHPSA